MGAQSLLHVRLELTSGSLLSFFRVDMIFIFFSGSSSRGEWMNQDLLREGFIAKVSLVGRALAWVLFTTPPGRGGRVCTSQRGFCTT